jgi:HEAT repeat protein
LAKAAAANQLSFCEGLFRCAEAQAAEGRKEPALKIYDRLRALKEAPHQVRAGALRGAVLTRGNEGLPMLLQAIRGEDFVLVAAAARTAQELPGVEVIKALADELGKLPADKQIVLIQALGKRADAEALPALFTCAKSGDKNVRIAAIHALPEIGKASAASVLNELQKDSDSEIAQAAKESLAALPN